MYSQDNIQQKIQQLNELPEGVHFNSAATWNKLEDRLQKKSKRRPEWYSVAAIFLLAVTGLVIFFLTNRSSDYKPVSIQGIDHKKVKTTTGFMEKHQSKSVKNKIEVTDKVYQPVKNISTQDVVKETPDIVTPVENAEVNTPIVTVIPVEQQPVIPAIPAVATNTVAKKQKLRVVHLDDIYQPDPVVIAKAETKKQQLASEEVQEPEPVITAPSKPFWKTKAPQRIAISLTDNP